MVKYWNSKCFSGFVTGIILGFVSFNPPKILLVSLEHSGWPVALFAIAVLFREPLTTLINRIKRYSTKNHQFDFDDYSPEDYQEFIRIKSEESQAPDTQSTSKAKNLETSDLLLTDVAPDAAIITFWSRLYGTLLSETKRLGYRHGNRPTFVRHMVQWLDDNNYLEDTYLEEILTLSSKRNRSAHATNGKDSASSLEARQFRNSCAELIEVLKKMNSPGAM